jgi:hypothetical protein
LDLSLFDVAPGDQVPAIKLFVAGQLFIRRRSLLFSFLELRSGRVEPGFDHSDSLAQLAGEYRCHYGSGGYAIAGFKFNLGQLAGQPRKDIDFSARLKFAAKAQYHWSGFLPHLGNGNDKFLGAGKPLPRNQAEAVHTQSQQRHSASDNGNKPSYRFHW